jgi:thiamine kinase-like enzyme
MIPEEKQEAVGKALEAAFGVRTYEEISRLTTGLSTALVYKIVVKNKPYLLKIVTRTDAFGDPTGLYSWMKSAAEAGIAPQVWYTSIEDKISITSFIETKPFPTGEAIPKIAHLLSKLHAFPPYKRVIHSLDTTNLFINKIKNSKILPAGLTDDLFQQFEKISAVYPRNNEDIVACHNDLKPENILYDGDSVWLADWEAAFSNDRYSDLAIVGNFILKNDADEVEYLKRYFGREATEYEYARFYLMQQIMHMSYFTVFTVFVSANRKEIDLDRVEKHEFRNFHDRMWNGDISLAGDEARMEYALVHLDQLKANMASNRFKESMRIVSGIV